MKKQVAQLLILAALLTILVAATLNISSASDVNIVNNVTFDLSDTAHIIFLSPQSASYINVSKTLGYLEFNLNDSWIVFRTDSNKTLSVLSYDNTSDIYSFTGSGTAGYLNITAKMNSPATTYGLYVDGSSTTTSTSNATGWATLNYTWSGTSHVFQVKQPITPTPTPTPTATATSAPGGGGGGGSVYYKANEPYLDILLNNITRSGVNFTIVIINEGDSAQEYIMEWSLKDNDTSIVKDSGGFSKKIAPDETFLYNITSPLTKSGHYQIDVTANYFTYNSKAFKPFTATFNETAQVITPGATKRTTSFDYLKLLRFLILPIIIILFFVGFYYWHKSTSEK